MFNEPTDWEHKPNTNMGKFPQGTYKFSITKSAVETNDYGDKFVKVEFTCIEGQYKGKKYFKNFNFGHQDQENAAKAYKHWVSTCKSIGKKVSVNVPEGLEQNLITLELDIFTNTEGKEYQYVSAFVDADARVAGKAPTAAATPHRQPAPPQGMAESEIPF